MGVTYPASCSRKFALHGVQDSIVLGQPARMTIKRLLRVQVDLFGSGRAPYEGTGQ